MEESLTWFLSRYSEILDYHNVKPDEEGYENGQQQQQ